MSKVNLKNRKIAKIFLGVVIIVITLAFFPSFLLNDALLNSSTGTLNEHFEKESTSNIFTEIKMGDLQVPIIKDGIYDKYRSNPPLSFVKEQKPNLDLSWFITLEKERKDVGFVTYSPNFYYSNSSITAIYTADMDTISKLIPSSVKEIVKPISFSPGIGLIAITSYAYHYCDNGSYNELSISIVTTTPRAKNFGLISLVGELNNKSLWGYVLKLPVDTELARVRGVLGYNLPKWLIPIKYELDNNNMSFSYYNEEGIFDFSMVGKRLDVKKSETSISRLNFINVDIQGRLTHGYSDVRAIKKASSTSGEDIQLNLSNGPISKFIKSLKIKKLVRYDYQPEFQAALYTPNFLTNE
ncbi:hypothetical protein M899_0574 [Bacteriovorax sp. BSW11_IV]|uniref:hypothetical protein n=1 Tax=Bacteriovorax sp. BSW11_IV TaxID=1353529 RepID=UPI00038A1625|nr:hypothetical protein [Bacteriovorax sp. BSW11_IV]EQC45008.1 hypothetical protein M899_0574 [Bacteriovorax sp. BSW11_IV]